MRVYDLGDCDAIVLDEIVGIESEDRAAENGRHYWYLLISTKTERVLSFRYATRADRLSAFRSLLEAINAK